MECKVSTTDIREKAFIVDKKEFMARVDRKDLECRESIIIGDYYKAAWFNKTRQTFILPTFCLKDGQIKECISGHHRTALLDKCNVDAMPIGFVTIDENGLAIEFSMLDEASKKLLIEIKAREIRNEDIIILPDLRIEE